MFLKNLLVLISTAIVFIIDPAAAEVMTKDGKPRYVETHLIPEFNSIISGQPLHFAITQKHTSGWHTYWKNPGDSGETTSIEWTLPDGFKAGEILYPAPERQPTGPLVNFGFAHNETLLTFIDVPQNIRGHEVNLTAKISWLVCRDVCIPEIKEITMTLPVVQDAAHTTLNHPEIFTAARAAIPPQKSWQGLIEEKDQDLIITFKLDEEGQRTLAGAKNFFFFPEEWGVILNAEKQDIQVIDDQLIIQLRRDTRPLSEIGTLNSVLTYLSSTGEKKSVSLSISVTAQGASPGSSSNLKPLQTDETSFVQAIFLALLGGLILNLMPCVFPVLSMKALSLVKMSEKEQKHANIHGLLYMLGILTCFGGIAGLLISLKMAGAQIGWGFQLQNPVVILLLAYLLFTMGLNLSGFFEIRSGPLANIGHRLASRHGYKGTFFTGVLATIVATPCTAPFMATAMGYALTQPPYVALSVFMALGIGLSLPYLLLCFIPPLRRSLPKPGAWMETFRQFLSFPLFASVAWLIWVYTQQVNGGYGALIGLSGLILIAFGIWISRHEPVNQPWKTSIHSLSIISILMALLIAGLSHTDPGKTQTDTKTTVPSISFSRSEMDKLIAGDHPIFVDMTASWCITCQVNERIAIYTDSTQSLFKEKNVQYVVGDWTNQNPEITAYLNKYERNGVPLYVFYGARDVTTGTRPAPIILPQLLTSSLIADVINGEE